MDDNLVLRAGQDEEGEVLIILGIPHGYKVAGVSTYDEADLVDEDGNVEWAGGTVVRLRLEDPFLLGIPDLEEM